MSKQMKQRSMPLVLRSLPISMDLKRYYWKKYLLLRQNNGAKYAAGVFKQLREVILRYVACTQRKSRMNEFLNQCPVRKNGWLKKLFLYADTEPQTVIQFLRLYLIESEPVTTVEEAANKLTTVLNTATDPGYTPEYITLWVDFISLPNRVVEKLCRVAGAADDDRTYYYAKKHLYEDSLVRLGNEDYHLPTCAALLVDELLDNGYCDVDIIKYHHIWHKIMIPNVDFNDEKVAKEVLYRLPTRSSYVDTQYGTELPPHYEDDDLDMFDKDTAAFLLCSGYWDTDFMSLYSELPEEFWELEEPMFVSIDEGGPSCGQIHHIPKSGTVDRRSIAVPNRYLQAGIAPCREFLRSMTRRMPQNCQFDQNKLDRQIYDHLMGGYAGCVDLSQSTDWLPIRWFKTIQEGFEDYWFNGMNPNLGCLSERGEERQLLKESFNLFYEMCDNGWNNGSDFVYWDRGQPLGTYPSFEILTIINTILIESISFRQGRLDSPYGVLGDDTVFFDKNVRQSYIETMEEAGSPLSLHKSYEGRLVEFAGKLFIRKQKIAYSPKPAMVYWTNLFDYQRSAKIEISYKDLPAKVRKRFECLADSKKLESGKVNPETLYQSMQIVADVPIRQMLKGTAKLLSSYYLSLAMDEDKLEPEPDIFYPTEVLNPLKCTLIRTGARTSVRVTEPWFQQKFRPVSTNTLAERCLRNLCGG